MFGRKSRAEKAKERAENSFLPLGTLIAAYTAARPVAERLLYDDDLRDNIRIFIESAQKVFDEVSGEDPQAIVGRLWDDDKLRKQIETAMGAAQEGSKRVRGDRVGGGGRGSRLLFLLLVGGVTFVFLNPRTGPEARRLVRETVGSLTSG